MADKRILTVDDSESVRSLVSSALRQAGFDVVEAVDGADALEKVSSGFDMVITDINMPNIGGIELLGELRTRLDTRFTPVLEADPVFLDTELGQDDGPGRARK